MANDTVDYHVGLLRGFLLAKDAHQQILHALDVVLTGYRSKAGGMIGRSDSESEMKNLTAAADPLPSSRPLPQTILAAADVSQDGKRVFTRWTKDETDLIDRLHGEGNGCAEILKKLNEEFGTTRKYQAVYSKMAAMELI